MGWFVDLLNDLATPSDPSESNFVWSTTAACHALVGAALFPYLGWWTPFAYALKELNDLRVGGTRLDGRVDTAFVALGCLYGPDWWPLAVFAAVLAGLIIRNTPPFRG